MNERSSRSLGGKIEEIPSAKICFKIFAEGNILRSSFRHEDHNKCIFQNWMIQYSSDNKVNWVLAG
jgi:hypothetical protein